MLQSFFLITFRNVAKNKVFILINVVGIGIATACCIVAFLNWEFNNDWDNNHVNSNNIYRVQCWHYFQGDLSRYGTSPIALGSHVKQNIMSIDKVVRLIPSREYFKIKNEFFSAQMMYVDPDFFELFTFDLIHGTFGNFGEDDIFISDELAQKYFGREDVVGQLLIQIEDGQPKEYLIAGIFKKQPLNSSIDSDAVVLWDNYFESAEKSDDNNWQDFAVLFFLIRDEKQLSNIYNELQRYVEPQNLARKDFKVKEYYLQRFNGMAHENRKEPRLYGEWLRVGLPSEATFVPTILATLLLILACFNFANTSIAVSNRRLREFAIRRVLGGEQKQLIVQVLFENILICLAGLLVGLVFAEYLVPAYNSLANWLELDLQYVNNMKFISFIFILLIVTSILAGCYPAFYITSFDPAPILKNTKKHAGANWVSYSLLGLQFGISLICITFAVCFYRNAEYQKNYDLGFSSKGIISVSINGKDYEVYRNALMGNSNIKGIAPTENNVFDNLHYGSIKHGDVERTVQVMNVGDGYLETMNIKLLEGRGFADNSESDRLESVIVTEEFVAQFDLKDGVLEKRLLYMDSIELHIIGVVKDIYNRALWSPIEPLIIRLAPLNNCQQLIVRTPPDNVRAVNRFMEEKWKQIFPNTFYDSNIIDDEMAKTSEINSNAVTVFSFLGLISILLSASGLYTLISLQVMKKSKEIAIRRVLGAGTTHIVYVINFAFISVMLFATVFGSIIGYVASNRVLDSVWDYYKELDLLSIFISVLFMLILGIISVAAKTFKAASENPTKALRND